MAAKLISLKEFFETKLDIIRGRLDELDKALILAREQLEKEVTMASSLMLARMDGFPDQFIRKGDADVALTEIKSQVAMVMASMSKIDLAILMPRVEYNIQHQQLSEKIGAASLDIAEKTELARKSIEEKTNSIKDTTDLKFAAMEKRVQASELLKAEITGKIWTLGIVLSIGVIVLEFIIKFVLKA
jgi:hypothetical protein